MDFLLSQLKEWQEYVIPCLTIVLSYWIGCQQSVAAERQSTCHKIYDEYYWPIIKEFYTCKVWERPFSQHRVEFQMYLYSLINSNLQYMDTRDFAYRDQFVLLCYRCWPTPESPPPEADLLKELDTAFILLILRILRRGAGLASKLHRTKTARYVLRQYLSIPEVQEIQREARKKRLAHWLK